MSQRTTSTTPPLSRKQATQLYYGIVCSYLCI